VRRAGRRREGSGGRGGDRLRRGADGRGGPRRRVGRADTALGEGPALGKRYADDERGLELLCSRAGTGALTVDGEPLLLKGAKPLPSSD